VTALVHLTPLEAGYPPRLRASRDPPASITLEGGPLDAQCAVAIVGSRRADDAAAAFAHQLAGALARAGAVVVSGGAVGIDAAAHRGALDAGGRTWAVAPTGHGHCFPASHAPLFRRIASGPGTMVWPFAPDFKHLSGFHARNRVLATLSDAVVVVQAGERSGALHAAARASEAGKPLWVVPAAPWMRAFTGSLQLLAAGARPLTAPSELLRAMSLAGPDDDPGTTLPDLPPDLPADARAVLEATPRVPSHADAIASAAGLTAQVASAALLTLALENVVVEGPPGFFRRTNGYKH
jgi:DNA processing protein